VYAIELYEALRASGDIAPMLVAGMQPRGPQPAGHPGTPFKTLSEDPNQHLVVTEVEGFDFFLGTMRDKSLYTRHFADFLRAYQPDVVHFQHTQFIGYDLVSLVARVLPRTPIIYTLHEYLPICLRDGQMLRTNGELCTHESPLRCNGCFPDWSQQHFFLRKQLIQRHLSHVDLFLAPSRFLLERYVDWGIPREKLRFEDYGRLPVAADHSEPTEDGRLRNRLAFFGQINRYKGLDVLLGAMKTVVREHPDAHLWIHGANLAIQPDDLQRDFRTSVEGLQSHVTFSGAYDHTRLPQLMRAADWIIVPSRWWENSPLVIQESFLHRRPVICSDIGGMAEKVTDGVNGLHFRVEDRVGLAEVIGRAVSTPSLWEQLRGGIPEIFSMEEHIGNLTGIYRDLITRRMSPSKVTSAVVAER
jgi:glycosyltransferase involved in cell wall biosynthesis